MNRYILIAVGIALAGAAAWGIVQWRQASRCSDLHDDFLNAFDSQKRAIVLGGLGGAEVKEAAELIRTTAEAQGKTAIEQLVLECGSRAADTAIREASETVL